MVLRPFSAQERALELAERLAAIGPIEVKRFFGGAGLSKGGIQFAFVVKGTLYVRVADLDRPTFEVLNARPFTYSSRSQTVTVRAYYELPDEIADDADEFQRWAEQAYRAAVDAKFSSRKPKR